MFPRLGEFCCCCCLPLLPELASWRDNVYILTSITTLAKEHCPQLKCISTVLTTDMYFSHFNIHYYICQRTLPTFEMHFNSAHNWNVIFTVITYYVMKEQCSHFDIHYYICQRTLSRNIAHTWNTFPQWSHYKCSFLDCFLGRNEHLSLTGNRHTAPIVMGV